MKKEDNKSGSSSGSSESTESCESGLPPVDNSKPVDPNAAPCVACANKKDRDRKLELGKTPCARCAKKKKDDAARKAKEQAEWDYNHPCEICKKDKVDKEELTVPTAVNATH